MYQYFKRKLKTPTCFGSFGIHPQGVVGVWQREIWTCGVCVWCDELRTVAHKTSQVISVKHV